jgi:hypothetical protein
MLDGWAITGDGPVTHLSWMVRECENCEFCAAQVENTWPAPQRTGSLHGLYLALQQHNAGSVRQYPDLMMRPLPAEEK